MNTNMTQTPTGAVSAHNAPGGGAAHNAKVMNRFELTKRLVGQLKHDEAVIGGIGNANFDLWATGQRPQNFYMLGSMGLTIPIGLGVAIAQPQRHVVALEGDGSLLMQLGCLATVAMLKPKNLTMVIWDNGIYQITGNQPTASAATADLVAIARGSGLANSNWAADEEDFDRLFAAALKAGVPTLIAARIDNKPGVGATDRDPVQIRSRFMQGLGVKK
jgi:thiamine pyrophosphate-dependent acetolactate synthase large subunit-like protein